MIIRKAAGTAIAADSRAAGRATPHPSPLSMERPSLCPCGIAVLAGAELLRAIHLRSRSLERERERERERGRGRRFRHFDVVDDTSPPALGVYPQISNFVAGKRVVCQQRRTTCDVRTIC